MDNTELENRVRELERFISNLQNASTIPLPYDQAHRARFREFLVGSATLNFPNTAGEDSSTLTIPVVGARPGDPVTLGLPHAAVVSNGSWVPWVSANDVVSIEFSNNLGTDLNPGSGVFTVLVWKIKPLKQ